MTPFDAVLLDKPALFTARSLKKYVRPSSKGISEIKTLDIEIDTLVKFLMSLLSGLVPNPHATDSSPLWSSFAVHEALTESLFGSYVNFKSFTSGGELSMITPSVQFTEDRPTALRTSIPTT